jgi:hypothetical protein
METTKRYEPFDLEKWQANPKLRVVWVRFDGTIRPIKDLVHLPNTRLSGERFVAVTDTERVMFFGADELAFELPGPLVQEADKKPEPDFVRSDELVGIVDSYGSMKRVSYSGLDGSPPQAETGTMRRWYFAAVYWKAKALNAQKLVDDLKGSGDDQPERWVWEFPHSFVGKHPNKEEAVESARFVQPNDRLWRVRVNLSNGTLHGTLVPVSKTELEKAQKRRSR